MNSEARMSTTCLMRTSGDSTLSLSADYTRNAGLISVATMTSRILGLVRDRIARLP